MKDILHGAIKGNDTMAAKFRSAVANGGVHMVELSQTMRKMQFDVLQCQQPIVHHASENTSTHGNVDESETIVVRDGAKYLSYGRSGEAIKPLEITWHSFFSQIDTRDLPVLIIGE